MTAWLMHGAGMARTQNAQTFTGQPLALQVEYGLRPHAAIPGERACGT